MFCKKCGEILNDNDKECKKCGTDVSFDDFETMHTYDRQRQKELKVELKRLEKESKKTNKKLSVFNIFKRIIIVLMILCMVLSGLFIAIYYYTLNSPYDTYYNDVKIEKYLYKNNFNVLSYNDSNQVKLILNSDALNTILNDNIKAIEENLDSNVKIEMVKLDLVDNRLYLNGSYMNFKTPLSFKIQYKVENEKVKYTLSDIRLGNKNLKIPRFISEKFIKQNKEYEFDVESMSEIGLVSDALNTDGKLEVIINLKYDDIISEMRKYSFDTMVMEIYSEAHNENGKSFISKINLKEMISDSEFEKIVKDFFGEQKYLENIIIGYSNSIIKIVYDKYSPFIKTVESESDLLETKNEILLQKKVRISNELLLKLNDYLVEKDIYPLSDSGKLYNYETKEYIGVKTINDYYKVVDNKYIEEINNMDFIYDIINNQFMIALKLNSIQYLLVYYEQYEVISQDVFNVRFEPALESDIVELKQQDEERKIIEETIKEYFKKDEEIYVRYLKSDGAYAYGVVSFENKYQYIDSVALAKEANTWKVISDNEQYDRLNRMNPNFNIKTVPTIEMAQVRSRKKIMSEDAKETIISQFKKKGIYSSKANINIKFCSYIDEYVYVKLTDDKQYVYKVVNGGLKTILTKEEAMEIWELPPMLLLQD